MITLIDLGSVYWRGWFATKSGPRAYDVALENLTWYRQHHPGAIVCCDSFSRRRKEAFPDYKANRDPKPPEAIDALQAVEEWAGRTMRAEKAHGYEADDVIATLCDQAWLDPVRIVTEDKDLYALIDAASDHALLTRAGTIDEAGCVEKYRVTPAQIPDYLALMGDASDNIPGCPRIGMVAAAALLNRFGSIAGVQAASDEEILAVKGIGKTALENLRAWDPTLAQALVALDRDAPVRI